MTNIGALIAFFLGTVISIITIALPIILIILAAVIVIAAIIVAIILIVKAVNKKGVSVKADVTIEGKKDEANETNEPEEEVKAEE